MKNLLLLLISLLTLCACTGEEAEESSETPNGRPKEQRENNTDNDDDLENEIIIIDDQVDDEEDEEPSQVERQTYADFCLEPDESNNQFLAPVDFYNLSTYGADEFCDPALDGFCNPGNAINPVGQYYMPYDHFGHRMPTPHQYLGLTRDNSAPIYAMAKGHLIRVSKSANNEVSFRILHNCELYSYYGHITFLSNTKIQEVIEEHIPNWNSDGHEWNMILGTGQTIFHMDRYEVADAIIINKGEVLGIKDPDILPTALDIGVIDTSQFNGHIVGGFDVAPYPSVGNYEMGADTTLLGHAISFIEYLDFENKEIYARYLNVPAENKPPFTLIEEVQFGTAAKDIDGSLEGLWFPAEIYDINEVRRQPSYSEAGVFGITRNLVEPDTVYITFSLFAPVEQEGVLAASLVKLDPMVWDECELDEDIPSNREDCMTSQKRLSDYEVLPVGVNRNYATIENPGVNYHIPPSEVTTPGEVVCYDFHRNGTVIDQVYIKYVSNTEIHVKYFPRHANENVCPSIPSVDMSSDYHVFFRGGAQ